MAIAFGFGVKKVLYRRRQTAAVVDMATVETVNSGRW